MHLLIRSGGADAVEVEGDTLAALVAAALPSARVNSISLSGCHITAKGAVLLAKALREKPMVVYLNLNGNQISDEGAGQLYQWLKIVDDASALVLELSYNQISENGARALASALRYKKHVFRIDLSDNNIGDVGVCAIVSALAAVTSNTWTLYLHGTEIGDQGAKAIANLLSDNGGPSQLSLRNNRIGNSGARALLEALHTNTKLWRLNLNDNASITDTNLLSQIAALCDRKFRGARSGGTRRTPTLAPRRETVSTAESLLDFMLDAHSAPRAAENAATAHPSALVSRLQSESDVWNLRHEGLGDDAAAVVARLLPGATVHIVDLSLNKITNQGAAAVASALKKNSALQVLHIGGNGEAGYASRNNVTDACAAAFAALLEFNVTLREISLNNSGLVARGCALLAAALAKNVVVVEVDLSDNQIEDAGAAALGTALESNASLQTIRIRHNAIGDIGAGHLAGALMKNHTLTHLQLIGNQIGEVGASKLCAVVQEANWSLTRLDLRDNNVQGAVISKINAVLDRNARSRRGGRTALMSGVAPGSRAASVAAAAESDLGKSSSPVDVLCDVAARGTIAEMQRVLSTRPESGTFNQRNSLGLFPLYIAAAAGRILHCEMILNAVRGSVDVNQVTESGETALYVSAKEGHTGVLQLLLDHGADAEKATPKGYTPLMAATASNRAKCVHALLKAGANVHRKVQGKYTAMDIARKGGFAETIHVLDTMRGVADAVAAVKRLAAGANASPQPDSQAAVAASALRDLRRQEDQNAVKKAFGKERAAAPAAAVEEENAKAMVASERQAREGVAEAAAAEQRAHQAACTTPQGKLDLEARVAAEEAALEKEGGKVDTKGRNKQQKQQQPPPPPQQTQPQQVQPRPQPTHHRLQRSHLQPHQQQQQPPKVSPKHRPARETVAAASAATSSSSLLRVKRDGGGGGGGGGDDMSSNRSRANSLNLQAGEAFWESLQVDMDEIVIVRELGRGAFGVVSVGMLEGEVVAVKELFGLGGSSGDGTEAAADADKVGKEFKREVLALGQARCANILGFRGVCTAPRFLIATEYCELGNVMQYLRERDANGDDTPRALLSKIGYETAVGVAYLHRKLIVHCDLKSLNILVGGSYDAPVAKVADLGLAKQKTLNSISRSSAQRGAVGSAPWMAFELFDNQPNTYASDMFAYGQVLYELEAKDYPCRGLSLQRICMCLIRDDFDSLPPATPPPLVVFVARCRSRVPAERPTAKDAVTFFKEKMAHNAIEALRTQSRQLSATASQRGSARASAHGEEVDGEAAVASTAAVAAASALEPGAEDISAVPVAPRLVVGAAPGSVRQSVAKWQSHM